MIPQSLYSEGGKGPQVNVTEPQVTTGDVGSVAKLAWDLYMPICGTKNDTPLNLDGGTTGILQPNKTQFFCNSQWTGEQAPPKGAGIPNYYVNNSNFKEKRF